MHLIVGLGNPGAHYAQTRHNVGWLAIDRAAARWAVPLKTLAGARRGMGRVGTCDIVLATPIEWMNRTGPIVRALVDELAVPSQDLIVIHDDLDLVFGRLRIKRNGGAGGHNGILSVTTALETNAYHRLKLGIGRPAPGMDPADYVLDPFAASEVETLDKMLEEAILALECFVTDGPAIAMNRFNVRLKEEDSREEPPDELGTE